MIRLELVLLDTDVLKIPLERMLDDALVSENIAPNASVSKRCASLAAGFFFTDKTDAKYRKQYLSVITCQ